MVSHLLVLMFLILPDFGDATSFSSIQKRLQALEEQVTEAQGEIVSIYAQFQNSVSTYSCISILLARIERRARKA